MIGIFEIDLLSLSGDLSAVENAAVTVRIAGGLNNGDLANLFQDVDGTTPLSNPFQTNGSDLAFYAHDTDRYSIEIVAGSYNRTLHDRSVSTRPFAYPSSADISFDNSETSLEADDVQDALVELDSDLDVLNTSFNDFSQRPEGFATAAQGEAADSLLAIYRRPIISNNSIDSDHDIDISAGARVAADGSKALNLAGPLTKQLDASWAPGTNAGGLSSSLTLAPDTWYYAFLIEVGGAVDVGFDNDKNASNLITDHSATAYRMIGQVLTDSSADLIGFTQKENSFFWDSPITDQNANNPGTSARLVTLTVPPIEGIKPISWVTVVNTSSTVCYGLATSPLQSDIAPSSPLSNYYGRGNGSIAYGVSHCNLSDLPVNASGQLRFRLENSGASFNEIITTLGWIDPTI